MAIPPVPGKKLKKAQPAPKKAPQHAAVKKKAPAKKTPARKVAVDPSPTKAKAASKKAVAAAAVEVPVEESSSVIPVVAGKQKRRTKKEHAHKGLHRLLVGVNIFLALCVVTAGGGYAYLKYNLGRIDRVTLGCQVLRNCGDDDPGKPMNVLLVGSDTREVISKAERGKFGNAQDVGGQRTDTMMVLHVDPTAEKAAILSIPRDLWVPIAGTNFNQRINEAYGYVSKKKSTVTTVSNRPTTTGALGASVSSTVPAAQIKDGPERLIATIRNNLGIEIDHYIEVDFNSFRAIVGAVGGVVVPFPAPARDKLSGLNVPTAGCVSLTGDQALAYVRSRHFQYFEAGKWKGDPTGDIGRIQRQQDFIRRMLRKAISKGVRNPIKLNALVNAGVGNVKLDSALSTKDILRLGKQFKSLEPESVDMLTLPADGFRTSAGAAVLRLRANEAKTIIDRFNGIGVEPETPGKVPTIPPAAVRVLVLNGTGVNGQAGKTLHDLTNVGFGSGGSGDAPGGFGHAKTEIHYGAGQLEKAQLVQAYTIGGATLVPDSTLKGGDIQLILGAGFGGIRTTLTPPAGTTGSSVPSTTSTTRGAIPTPKGAAVLDC